MNLNTLRHIFPETHNLWRMFRQRQNYLESNNPRLGYIGWINQGNLGDEVMFEAVKNLIADASIFQYGGVMKEALFAKLGLTGNQFFNGIVLGGGTLINHGYLNIARLALEQNVPIWTLGTGAGSSGFSAQETADFGDWVPILNQFLRIGVRGPLSQERLIKAGVNRVEIIGDLALSLAKPDPQLTLSSPQVALNIALPNMHSLNDYECFDGIEKVVKHLVRSRWQIIPIAMTQDDILPIKSMLDRVNIKSPVFLPKTVNEFFNLIEGCSFTISVRLHAAVLSVCAGVPPMILGYRDKCLDFMLSMNLVEWYADLKTTTSGEAFEKVLQLSEVTTPKMRSDILKKVKSWQLIQRMYLANVRDNYLIHNT